jgi:cysteine desulfurase / selenocysteine lyase
MVNGYFAQSSPVGSAAPLGTSAPSARSAPGGGAPSFSESQVVPNPQAQSGLPGAASSSQFGVSEEQRMKSELPHRLKLAPGALAPDSVIEGHRSANTLERSGAAGSPAPGVVGPAVISPPGNQPAFVSPGSASHAPPHESGGGQSHNFRGAPAEAMRATSPFYFLNDQMPCAGALKDTSTLRVLSPNMKPSPGQTHRAFNVEAVRRDFPILGERVNGGKPLVWLDNAATTQKPQVVIDRLTYFYQHENSNIHRAAHELAARATDAYEEARTTVARFLGASSAKEIVFTRGATEAINLVAQSFGKQKIGRGDEIVITHMEHHANIVPWQLLCREVGATLRVAPVDDRGELILGEFHKLLGSRTRLVAFPQISNVLGTVNPAAEIIDLAHRAGAVTLMDSAQSVAHLRQNVQALDADFVVFSGHKIFAPTGIGVLYGKSHLLADMPPYQGGGNMIEDVTFDHTRFQPAPAKFEAGTGSIADAVGLSAALKYLETLGLENIERYEHELLGYATSGLSRIPGLRMIGTAPHKASVLSFDVLGLPADQLGAAITAQGFAIRVGHHCAQPILRRFGLETSLRASLALYNTHSEVDRFVETVRNAVVNVSGPRRR